MEASTRSLLIAELIELEHPPIPDGENYVILTNPYHTPDKQPPGYYWLTFKFGTRPQSYYDIYDVDGSYIIVTCDSAETRWWRPTNCSFYHSIREAFLKHLGKEPVFLEPN